MQSSLNTTVGRFAPSPTGPLHFGSLVAALASFLDAKQQQGQWLVRIEDIDPPRELAGAGDAILAALLAHGLQWDGELVYQSQRTDHYQSALQQLSAQGYTYACSCSRQRLASLPKGYDGHCLTHPPQPGEAAAIKLKTGKFACAFGDIFQGPQQQPLLGPADDFVLWRKDGLVAYQLAVVVDDIAQGVNTVVRGSDLLSSTSKQILLARLLGSQEPVYGHLPVVKNQTGQKLSKQNHAPAIDINTPQANLWQALHFLRQSPPPELERQPVAALLRWGVEHWQRHNIPAFLGMAQSGVQV